MAQRVNDRLRPVIDLELAQDRCDVVFDGLVTDPEEGGDLLVGIATSDTIENLDLTRCEW